MAEKFSSGVHLQVDTIRESMVSGFASPGEFNSEAIQQFRLARKVAKDWAITYADESISVVIDDVCIPESFTQHYSELGDHPNVTRVLLNPSRDVLIERITQRGGPFVEFFVNQGVDVVLGLIDAMPKQGWLVVDSSNLSIEQTLRAITEHLELDI